MIIEFGHFALVMAFAVALAQAFIPLYAFYTRSPGLYALATPAAQMQFGLVALAFAVLTFAYVTADFSVLNVYQNGHSLMPLIYRISGVWGNHEGSMLLWVLVLAIFGAAITLRKRLIAPDFLGVTLSVQGLLAAAFIAFILFTSNPFVRVINPPLEGRELNPVLQDLGLAIHPPLLYFGYVGFSIVFSFAAAALLLKRVDSAFAVLVRPWVMLAWSALTLGIAMGSYWAYYELGWGGYWFWDPVENASLMPWLTGTALLHCVIVMEKREALKIWTILLAVLTFSLSLLGTFLVRSGILTSVHAFAVDPERGVFILLILLGFIGGALALFAARAPLLKTGRLFTLVSREGALVFNNLFLATAGFGVLLGTLYPLFIEAISGDKISVGPPYFNATILPLLVPLAVALPIGQKLPWKRAAFWRITRRLWLACGAGFVTFALCAFWFPQTPLPSLAGLGLGVYMLIGAFDTWLERAGRGSLRVRLMRWIGLPRRVHTMVLAHLGCGLFVLGISASAFETAREAVMRVEQNIVIERYVLTLEQITTKNGPNFTAHVARFKITEADEEPFYLEPAKRVYAGRSMPTSEVARVRTGLSEVYLAIGEIKDNSSVEVRVYYKPLVLLIWLGPLLMGLAGLLSLIPPLRRASMGAHPPKKVQKTQKTKEA